MGGARVRLAFAAQRHRQLDGQVHKPIEVVFTAVARIRQFLPGTLADVGLQHMQHWHRLVRAGSVVAQRRRGS